MPDLNVNVLRPSVQSCAVISVKNGLSHSAVVGSVVVPNMCRRSVSYNPLRFSCGDAGLEINAIKNVSF